MAVIAIIVLVLGIAAPFGWNAYIQNTTGVAPKGFDFIRLAEYFGYFSGILLVLVVIQALVSGMEAMMNDFFWSCLLGFITSLGVFAVYAAIAIRQIANKK